MVDDVQKRRGVFKIEDGVFHFPKFKENGLSDFYKPHVAVDNPPGGPSLTRQEFKEECDVNEIMARYEHTGILPNAVGEPFYYDFTTLPETMMDAMIHMRDASDAFMTLPAKVRREFDNDAAAFADYASDPANLDQMREWGLAKPKPPEPAPAAPVPAAPGDGSSPLPGSVPGGARRSSKEPAGAPRGAPASSGEAS